MARSIASPIASTRIGSKNPLTCSTSTRPTASEAVPGTARGRHRVVGLRPDGRAEESEPGHQRAGCRSLVFAKVPPESEYPLQSLTAARVVVVAGKGGVGKTTVTAVMARAASNAGRRVLVVELDGKPTLAELVPDLDVVLDLGA